MQLRKFTVADAERVATLVNDEAISRWTSKIPFPCTPQHVVDWIESLGAKLNRNPYAVIVNGDIVASVSWWPDGEHEIEVGYWVGKDYWGQGIASQALALLLSLPEIPQHKPLVARVLLGNAASERVLLNNGFTFTGECELNRMGKTVAGRAFARSLSLRQDFAPQTRARQYYDGSCHCGTVQFRICTDFPELTTCDCSICRRKNALMVKVHESDFELLAGADALTLYQFHTHTAQHYFCKICGIYPFHRKRSAPDSYGINVFCLEEVNLEGVPVRATDGVGMP